MGIQGLHKFVKEAVEDIHIKKYAGGSVAVDTYCWIHRGSFACADKLAKKERTDVYVKYCIKFISMLEAYHVKPVLVFDGCHLPSKAAVEQQRHQRRMENLQKGRQFLREGNSRAARDCFTKCVSVTSEMALEVMRAARNMGVDCIVAPYEADAQLAFFSKYGHVDAVVTEDSDLLCFGCKRVVFKMDLTGRAQEISLENLGRVKTLVGFTPDLFRQMCILSGCDYLPSVKGVGLAKACKAIKLSKSKDAYEVARKLHQYIKNLPPVDPEYVARFERADRTFLYQLVFNPYERILVPLNPYPAGLTADNVKYAGETFSDDVALQLAVGNVHVTTKKVVSQFDIDSWVRKRVSMSKLPSIWSWKAAPAAADLDREIPVFKAVCLKKSPDGDFENNTEVVSKTVLEGDVSSAASVVTTCAQVKQANNHIRSAQSTTSPSRDPRVTELLRLYKMPLKPKQVTKSRFFPPRKSVAEHQLNANETKPLVSQNNTSVPEDNLNGTERVNENDLLDEILEELTEQNLLSSSQRKRKNPFSKSASPSKNACSDESLVTGVGCRKAKVFFSPKIPEVNDSEPAVQNGGVSSPHSDVDPENLSTEAEEAPVKDDFDYSQDIVMKTDNVSQAVDPEPIVRSPRRPLSIVLGPNGQKNPTYVVSSDDDDVVCLDKRRKPNSCMTLRKKVSTSKTNIVSKYFGAAKASGLRKAAKPQTTITSFFAKAV